MIWNLRKVQKILTSWTFILEAPVHPLHLVEVFVTFGISYWNNIANLFQKLSTSIELLYLSRTPLGERSRQLHKDRLLCLVCTWKSTEIVFEMYFVYTNSKYPKSISSGISKYSWFVNGRSAPSGNCFEKLNEKKSTIFQKTFSRLKYLAEFIYLWGSSKSMIAGSGG